MEDGKSKPDAVASSSTISMGQRPSDERGSGSSLPDSPEEINVLSESKANSGPPASYADVIGNNYYVFLSFRGLDTRKGFIDYLYHELVRVGLHLPNFAFRDDENLNPGEPIEMVLNAIKCSKVSIPVISENYATSKWCLLEIIQIMECMKSNKQKVYPVFYKVTPGNVKGMDGDFGEAFRRDEHKLDAEVKRKGLEALRGLVDCTVIETEKFANGHEGEFVIRLVEAIMSKHQHDFLPLPKDLVGIDDHVAKVMNLAKSRTVKSANTASSETQIIVIYGIGGIGKTTLATTIYKKLFNQFEYRSSLNDIRETIKSKGIKYVQSLHISNLTKRSGHSENASGIEPIRRICEKKKVLIFLDDVDHRDHLNNLIGGCTFESGSWIIITCRDKALLKSEYKEYELEKMNHINSLALFKRHAFQRRQPSTELLDLSRDIVTTTEGLPLALVIIGSFLEGKDQSIWTETLQKLRKVPHMDVQQKLRISYDSLEYEEQQMFLDIACFFIGINKRFATYLWEDLQYYVDSGLGRMIELSLIKIDDNNELRMHDQLRDLGRAIACPANKKAWKCSRLWDEKAIIVQRSKEENRYIEALRLDENGSNMFMNQRSFKRMPYLKFLHLEVDYVLNFEDSLSELRWVEWKKCPNSFGVANLHLEKLLILDLSYGYITHEWRGWSSIKMERLKVLNLSKCIELKRTPNLSALKSLEMLILIDCYNLKEIDPSIGDVKCLTSLNLNGCFCLRELPDSIGHLVNLSTLDLRFCSSLEGFPDSIGSLVKLQRLLLGNMALPFEDGYFEGFDYQDIYSFNHIPDSIGKLESLTELHLTCAKISEFPQSIGNLKTLKILKILGCKKLRSLPSTISNLSNLEELDATACDILEGKVPINGLSSLKILRLGELGQIVDLFSLKTVGGLSVENFTDLSSEQCLDLTNCDFPDNLTILEVTCCNPKLPQLSHLKDLKELSFQFCESLESIPVLPSGILNLWVIYCGKLEKLPSLSSLKSLSELHIIECGELMEIKGLKGLKYLRGLSICGCKKLSNLNSLEHLESLRELEIEDLNASLMNDPLFQVLCLGGLKNLEMLRITCCQTLTRLDISQLTHLRELIIFHCEDVEEIYGLEGLKKLRYLNIRGCNSISKLPDLSLFDNLGKLDTRGCSNLQDVQGLEKVKLVFR